jgi:hypothetical protein
LNVLNLDGAEGVAVLLYDLDRVSFNVVIDLAKAPAACAGPPSADPILGFLSNAMASGAVPVTRPGWRTK